jgi:pimeloyl-ACP methyl ester carboxylesterase/DNA-binding CsgD family transcriptional regulator
MSRRQRVRYLQTADGLKLAWAESGSGPTLVKAANWLTHLELDLESPVWKHWIEFFSDHFRFVRFDERGCGMSDWTLGDLAYERWPEDLEAVIEAAGIEEPFALLGISQGAAACLSYAAAHPERVSHLVLYGAYARGVGQREDAEAHQLYKAIIEVARLGWGTENPSFRQVFTSRFIPGGTAEQLGWFNDLCRRTTTAEIGARLMEERSRIDVDHLLGRIRTPTLVLHAREDAVVTIAEGRRLAARIAGAQFVELESKNHILLAHEPSWRRFCDVVLDFVGLARTGEHAAFATLSPREREILALITEGLANAEIAQRLGLSEKTVRNHVSNLFDKLGVWTRAQAIVFARDRHFAG